MDRKIFLFRRRLRYMGILFAVFLGLFGIFDLIVYTRTQGALYEDLDRQMTEAGEMIRRNAGGAVESFAETISFTSTAARAMSSATAFFFWCERKTEKY